MTTVPDLVVLGGGIVGLTSALAAANRGMRVTLIDQLRPGASSRASAGILAPSVDGLPRAVLSAASEARDFYPGFLDDLASQTDLEVPLDRSGVLELAMSPDALHFCMPAGRSPDCTATLDAVGPSRVVDGVPQAATTSRVTAAIRDLLSTGEGYQRRPRINPP